MTRPAYPPLKIASARRQLGTALHMWIRMQDPVSIQCLACAASEVLDHYADRTSQGRFINILMEDQPDLDLRSIRKMQRQFWNAFKHATGQGDGAERDDEELLADFYEEANEAPLLVGWVDYGTVTGRLPIEAQVFQAWYFAKYPDKLAADVNADPYRNLFGADLGQISPKRQRARFVKVVERVRKDREVMAHPMTEPGPLVLPWPPDV